jgi:hypothetical protein
LTTPQVAHLNFEKKTFLKHSHAFRLLEGEGMGMIVSIRKDDAWLIWVDPERVFPK